MATARALRLFPLVCRSEPDYYAACSDRARPAEAIPILDGFPSWPICDVFSDEVEPGGFDAAATLDAAIAWGGRMHAGGPLVVAMKGPSSVAATVLCGTLGGELRTFHDTFADEALRTIGAEGGRPCIVVALREHITDGLLMGFIDILLAALASEAPWGRMPRCTLLTGDGIAALSWVVAKAIAASRPRRNGDSQRRFVHFATDGGAITARELRIDAEGCRTIAERLLDHTTLRQEVAEPSAAAVFQTHGVDPCAQGGDGTVLCGLRWDGVPTASTQTASWRARADTCVRVRRFRCRSAAPRERLLPTSCNALRLADSAVDPHFSLGLAFLDLPGLGYVSSITSAFGHQFASQCFLAALASGGASRMRHSSPTRSSTLHASTCRRTSRSGSPTLALGSYCTARKHASHRSRAIRSCSTSRTSISARSCSTSRRFKKPSLRTRWRSPPRPRRA